MGIQLPRMWLLNIAEKPSPIMFVDYAVSKAIIDLFWIMLKRLILTAELLVNYAVDLTKIEPNWDVIFCEIAVNPCRFIEIYLPPFLKGMMQMNLKSMIIKGTNGRFHCNLCVYHSDRAYSVKRHLIVRHMPKNKQANQCPQCLQSFTHKDYLRKHQAKYQHY